MWPQTIATLKHVLKSLNTLGDAHQLLVEQVQALEEALRARDDAIRALDERLHVVEHRLKTHGHPAVEGNHATDSSERKG